MNTRHTKRTDNPKTEKIYKRDEYLSKDSWPTVGNGGKANKERQGW